MFDGRIATFGQVGFDCALRNPKLDGFGVVGVAHEGLGLCHAEPIQFRIPEGAVEAYLAERGYATVEHLVAAGLEKRYLTLASGDLAGAVLACFGLVCAEVEPRRPESRITSPPIPLTH